MTKKEAKLPTLEKSIEEISSLIEKMEQGDLTLEESLTHFERGIGLIKHCQKTLSEAEQKVQVLLQANEKDTLVPFSENDNG